MGPHGGRTQHLSFSQRPRAWGKGGNRLPDCLQGCFQACCKERQREKRHYCSPYSQKIPQSEASTTCYFRSQEVGIWSVRAMGHSPQTQILRLYSPRLTVEGGIQILPGILLRGSHSEKGSLPSQSADIVCTPGKSQKESEPQQDKGPTLCFTDCHSSKLFFSTIGQASLRQTF